MTPTRTALVMRISTTVALLVALPTLAVILSRTGEAVGWGERITALEKVTRELAAGQSTLAGRVDVTGFDLAGLRRELSQTADRGDRNLQELMAETKALTKTLNDYILEQAKENKRNPK